MELSFGQRIDPENGLVELWLTHGALDWVKQQDWSGKIVWMFGAGLGDVWLSKRCKELHVVERNAEWIYKQQELAVPNGVDNLFYYHRPCNDCSGMDKEYCDIPIGVDVIINDDAYRTEVCIVAVDYFMKRNIHGHGGGVLICDNWIQSYVWISPKAEETMKPFRLEVFEQADHADNDGVNKWKTAIFYVP
jgi:hypothetical protein